LPPHDKHAEKINFFWPNGMTNLTDAGRMRQYRIGYELRRRYSKGFNNTLADANRLLAFSSSIYRCLESTRQTLGGFFNLDQSKAAGLSLLRDYNSNCHLAGGEVNKSHHEAANNLNTCSTVHLAPGSGSPNEWQRVPIDTLQVPTLNWEYLDACKKHLNVDWSTIDLDLLRSKAVSDLEGILQLKDTLLREYNLTFVYDTIHHWSTILTELRLEHTWETIKYTDHFRRWIATKVSLEANNSLVLKNKDNWAQIEKKLPTLFDVYEMLNLYVSRDRIPEGPMSRVQLGPMLTSLVDSQLVALDSGHQLNKTENGYRSRVVDKQMSTMYDGKKVVLYFTHDTILQLLMFRTHMIEEDLKRSYADRFIQNYDKNPMKQYLAGLRCSEFGASLVFELYEMKRTSKPVTNNINQADILAHRPSPNSTSARKSFPFVRAAFYFEEDPILAPIEFKYLHLGSICRRWFKSIYPNLDVDQLFYDENFTKHEDFNEKKSCPFELFRNLTMQHYAIDLRELRTLCQVPK